MTNDNGRDWARAHLRSALSSKLGVIWRFREHSIFGSSWTRRLLHLAGGQSLRLYQGLGGGIVPSSRTRGLTVSGIFREIPLRGCELLFAGSDDRREAFEAAVMCRGNSLKEVGLDVPADLLLGDAESVDEWRIDDEDMPRAQPPPVGEVVDVVEGSESHGSNSGTSSPGSTCKDDNDDVVENRGFVQLVLRPTRDAALRGGPPFVDTMLHFGVSWSEAVDWAVLLRRAIILAARKARKGVEGSDKASQHESTAAAAALSSSSLSSSSSAVAADAETIRSGLRKRKSTKEKSSTGKETKGISAREKSKIKGNYKDVRQRPQYRQLRDFHRIVRPSLLSIGELGSGSGEGGSQVAGRREGGDLRTTDYRGFVNLSMIVLGAMNARLIVENYLKCTSLIELAFFFVCVVSFCMF